MPDFTFIKHGSGKDPNLTMVFSSDSLETVQDCFEDFVRGSGFVIKEEVVTEEDTSPTESDDWEYEDSEEILSFLDKYRRTDT